jgi:bifunctional ADP-heptose synthase (sugar kinase/adenylyltransferase)
LGDFFLDKYLDVAPELEEISVETGKRAHQVKSIRSSPGAAGTVVNNLAALDAGELHLIGFTGDDGEGFELRRALVNLGCDVEGLLVVAERLTPTYLKPRDCRTAALSGEHERYDTKNRIPTPTRVLEQALSHLERLFPNVNAVIVLDQVEEEECGIITKEIRQKVIAMAADNPGKIFWADSRCRIGKFRNVMIKINAVEAVKETLPNCAGATGDDIIIRAVSELRARTGRPVFVTAGHAGIWISDPEPRLVRGVKVEEPTDPTGAGDSATAGAVLALCSGATPQEAAEVANLVASITVQQLATTGTARREQLAPRLELWHEQGQGGVD